MQTPQRPIRVAAVNDYELIVEGVGALLRRYPEQVEVCDRLIVGETIRHEVDVALYDTYGRVGAAAPAVRRLASDEYVGHVAMFSLDLRPTVISEARAAGASGFISKALPGHAIVDALRRVATGEVVEALTSARRPDPALDWPGRADGLTQRESQVLVLCAEGLTNGEIAAALYIGIETVKSHLRSAFRRANLRNRTHAAAYVERSGAFARFAPKVASPLDQPSARQPD